MPASPQKTNIIDLLIPLFALGLMTFGIGNYGLYEPHESHFAMVGNEMVWRGDWITPYLNGAPYLNKPPLLYWSIAVSTTFFGNSEFAVRLPVAIASWLGILIAGKWSKDLWGVTANRITVLMLSVNLGWFIFSHQVLTDVLLATLLLSSNYFLWKLLHKPRSPIYFFCLYLSIALCLLTKGLIGIFFIFCSYIAIAFYHRSWSIFAKTKLLRGSLLVVALVLPWCIAIEKANPGFWHYFVFNEHIGRMLDRRFPPDYVVSKVSVLGYLGIAALWCIPWILFLPSVIKTIVQKMRSNHNKQKTPQQDAILLLTITFLLPIIFFLPLSSRLIYYSIPAIPAYIVLCSGTFISQLSARDKPRFQKLSIYRVSLKFNLDCGYTIYSGILITLGLILLTAIAFFPKLFVSFEAIKNYSVITSSLAAIIIILALGFLISGIELLKRNYNLSFKSLVISLFVFYSIITIVFSFYQDVRSSKNLVRLIDSNLPLNTLWIFEGSREIGAAGGIAYYLNQGADIRQTEASIAKNEEIPSGLVSGKNQKLYRNVLVLEDGGKNRIPPRFPGKKPNYLIDRQQLQIYWDSIRPVVFVTDFMRDLRDTRDPINLNLPNKANRPFLSVGKRQVYLNQAAMRNIRS